MKYEIKGDNLPVVICHLEKGESMITDSGAMSWMDPVMEMETTSGGLVKHLVECLVEKQCSKIVIMLKKTA